MQRVIRTVPIHPEIRHPLFGGPPRIFPGGEEPKVKLFGIFQYTFDQATPTNWAAIQSNYTTKGWNWAQWEAAIRARITARGGTWDDEDVVAGQQVYLHKRSVLDAISMCDVALLGFSPPKEHLDYIRQNSRVGTKLLTGLENFESIAAGSCWNPIQEAERTAARPYVLPGDAVSGCDGDGLNAYGCTVIDKYEKRDSCSGYAPPGADATVLCSPDACGVGKPPLYASGTVGCPHTPRHAGLPANAAPGAKHSWDCDVRQSAYRAALVSAIHDRMETYYKVGGAYIWNGALWDNHGEAYKGDSTLSFPSGYTNSYVNGWKAFDLALLTALASWPVGDRDFWHWGNCSDAVNLYAASDLRNRWNESFFLEGGSTARTWTQIQTALDRVQTNGLRVAIGIASTYQNQHYWALTAGGPNPAVNGTWAQLVQKIREMNLWQSIYVQALRQSTSGGYAFWQEGFRKLE